MEELLELQENGSEVHIDEHQSLNRAVMELIENLEYDTYRRYELGGDEDRKDPLENDQLDLANPILINENPAKYHTITHKVCEFKVVQRELRVHPEVNTSQINFRESIVSEIVIMGEIKEKIETQLKIKATAEFLTKWQVITGLPLPAGVRIGASVEASIAASMAQQMVIRGSFRMIHYRYVVDGTLCARLVVKVKELWDWEGPDCNNMGITPNPTIQEYIVKDDDYQKIPIKPLVFDFYEFTPAGMPMLGRPWADNERNKAFREKIQQAWKSGPLRTLPLPQGMPSAVQ